jgi:hypothetical protein
LANPGAIVLLGLLGEAGSPVTVVSLPAHGPPCVPGSLIRISGHGPGGPPRRMKTAARQGPWAVHCSAEGASAASTVSVTCEFALAAGHFQPRHIRGMRSSSKSARRPGHRRHAIDRGCRLGTGVAPSDVAHEWHGRPGTKVVRTCMEPDERVHTIRAARSNVQGTVLRSSTRVAVAAPAAAAVVTVQAWGLRRPVGADRRRWRGSAGESAMAHPS